jgi:jumonji domain-containing protein 2
MKDDSVVETKDVVHPNKCVKIPEITTPFIMLGLAGSATACHVEDIELYSVNYLHSGTPKHWII